MDQRQAVRFFLFSSLFEICISIRMSCDLLRMTRSVYEYVTTKTLMSSSHHGCPSCPTFLSPSLFPGMGLCSRRHLSHPFAKRDVMLMSRMVFPVPGSLVLIRDHMLSAHEASGRADGLKLLLLYPVLWGPSWLPPAAWAAVREGTLPRALSRAQAVPG